MVARSRLNLGAIRQHGLAAILNAPIHHIRHDLNFTGWRTRPIVWQRPDCTGRMPVEAMLILALSASTIRFNKNAQSCEPGI